MKDLNVNVGDKNVELHLPTKLSEIKLDYLQAVTRNVVIEKNYALVALCVNGTLATFANMTKKNVDVSATVILVDYNDPSLVLHSNVGNVVICSPTDIMRGYEVSSPVNVLAPSKVIGLISKDKQLLTDIFKHLEHIYLITFKLVPISDIHGSYNNPPVDPKIKEIIDNYCK